MRLGRSRALVTGAAGFIGSNLIARLLSSGADIRATFHKRRPVVRDRGIEYIRADLRDADACRKLVKGVDYVFMCAASTSGAAVIASNPIVHVTPNVVMNSRMLEASYLVGVKKFTWISSSVGYPPSGDRRVKEEEFFDGDPYDTYFASGWMKRYTEILCKMYSEKLEHHMPAVVLRPSNIYGPRDKFDLETSHVTAALVRKVVERHDPIVVWGKGTEVRDVIYIDDFIDAMLLATEKINSYDPVNVGYGKGFTIKEILNTLLKIDGYTAARIVHDYSKPSMIPVRLVDTRKAESVLGFRAKTTLREGLEKTVSWYRESRARLKK
jgi:GDP-L-fucose synthase